MRKRKIRGIIVSLALVLSLVITSTVTASAATVKINKTKASINVGSSISLKINNTSKKVFWSSNNKSVAVVKSTGTRTAKVTAKAPGKATITAKVNGKKYKCVVTTQYKLGSRQTPAIATDGVTVTTMSGKVNYVAKNILVGEDAKNLFKSIDSDMWKYWYADSQEELEGHKLVAIEYDVKVLSGYDEYALTGSELISTYSIYNSACNAQVSDVGEWYFSGTSDCPSRSELELYGGGSSSMCTFLLIPEDVTAFSTYHYDNNFNKYWVKYVLPQ